MRFIIRRMYEEHGLDPDEYAPSPPPKEDTTNQAPPTFRHIKNMSKRVEEEKMRPNG